uniref:serine/threonine protein kinase n=1 Tax=Nocardia terpenica TaxID=455432 RepID=UPI002B4AF024|nr:serine/threonine protein kinase [Nocardia terpenica]
MPGGDRFHADGARGPVREHGAGSRSERTTRRGSSRTRSNHSTRSSRGHLGAGLVTIPPMPYRAPSTAIMTNPVVPEQDRP